MRRPARQTADLEAELVRLNELVRQRRQQLARLEHCPHKDCECRQVWNEVIENKLATQVGKVRKRVRKRGGVRSRPAKNSRPKG